MFTNPLHILRSLQLLLAIIILGLDAYVASWYNSSAFLIPCPPPIAFLIFTAVWTMLVILPYTTFAPRYFPKIAHKYPMLIAETTTCLFWFAGFIAVADLLRKLAVCRGLVCQSAIAATVFGAFQFGLFAASSYFAIKHVSSPLGGKGGDEERNGSVGGSGSFRMGERKWWGMGREKGVERL